MFFSFQRSTAEHRHDIMWSMHGGFSDHYKLYPCFILVQHSHDTIIVLDVSYDGVYILKVNLAVPCADM